MDQPGRRPESDGVLTTLTEATLGDLAEACRKAVEEEKPFHPCAPAGAWLPGSEMHKQHFGMALHAEDGDLHAVLPEEIGDGVGSARRPHGCGDPGDL